MKNWIIASFVALSATVVSAENAPDVAAACAACHSPDGAGVPPIYPRVSGQDTLYTAAQLRAFRASERENDANGMMRVVASRLSEKEIEALAEYIAGLR